MVQHTTVALIQSIIALVAIVINASLQTNALLTLEKSNLKHADLEYAKKTLTAAIIMQFIAAVLMFTTVIMLLVYKKQLQQHMNKFIYVLLIISGVFLFVGGVAGAMVAVKLQCHRKNPKVNSAWRMATTSAVIGIAGSIAMLAFQSFSKFDTISASVKEGIKYFDPTAAAVAPPKPAATLGYGGGGFGAYRPIQKAPMPAHHPAPYQKKYSM